MGLTEDKLEILIGKCLDGQATPIERHLIEKEMNQDPKAKALFEQWQTLNEWGRGLVVDKLDEQGARPEDVFEQAWRRSRGKLWLRLARSQRHVRFAVGVAAGFLLGVLSLYSYTVWTQGTTGVEQSRRGIVADPALSAPTGGGMKVLNPEVLAAAQAESRNVDSYLMTDAAGNPLLVQRDVQQQHHRQGNGRLAAYSL